MMEDISLISPKKRKRKHKRMSRSEEDISSDHLSSEKDLDTSLSTVYNSYSDENREKKRKKKKKHKRDHDEHGNESTVNVNESEFCTKQKKKKKKKHSKKTAGLPCVYGINHQKEHLNGEAEHSSPSKRKAENGCSNSAGPSESPQETENGTNEEIDSVDNGDTSEDQDKTTRKSSSKSTKQRKQSRQKSIAALTLTEAETAIVHSGKFSSRQKDVDDLKEMGISLRVGKWLLQEDEILMENFESIKNDTVVDIDNEFLMQLLFLNLIGCAKMELSRVKTFLKESSFHVRLAGNLRRTPESVMDRARKILPAWNTGPFTDKEERKLLKLVGEYGNQWTIIGFHLNRSRNSVLDHYRIIKDGQRKKGKWTEDETNDLLQVISEVMQVDDLLSLPHFNMPWNRIGQRMSNRNGKQCRSHWVYQIRPMLVQGSDKKKNLNRDEVVAEILQLDIETESDIDWVDLMEKIPEAGTPQQLMYMWQKIKSSIAGVDRMTFDEIRDALQ
ncbi:uncharacterized protein LOC110450538 [Mizuhopecten yessoensis]|uniref:Cyclin-D-binding Myb-like transcription factor 1 n=1 Tax=Mizuhopecten yessoensis TaxID=6573 RepID=A0A210R598_MIZYE|nr:uncharacterized protein LOC110450538 [Mizuhopecten yessoensis]OWF56202.1 Cyclin-D-binding Myb-like transcription factor 1 [Mizuhopecten yessoensis]